MRWYLESRGYAMPTCVPLWRTPEPRTVKGAVFDAERVDRVIKALRMLRHTQGKWAGRPLEPAAWQVAYRLAPVYGWVAPNDDGRLVRIIRSSYLEVPRKNGKTTLGGGESLYLGFADQEPGAQVLLAAASKDQARFAYAPARLLAEKSPALKQARVRPMQSEIVQADTGAFVRVVSSIGDLLHGANVSGALVDELHAHKTSDVLDAIESGTGARDQPLVNIITTAGDGRPESVYQQRRDYIERLCKKVFTDPSTYGVIFAATERDDPFSEDTQRLANPGFGVSPTAQYMRDAATKARNSPADLANYQRLHLGVQTKQRTRFITLDSWDRNESPVDWQALAGRQTFGGLDLASTSDLCALAWLVLDPDRPGFDAWIRLWAPEAAVPTLDKRTAGSASRWVKAGLLTTTPGDVADYDFIKAQITSDAEHLDVVELGYDPYNASQLTNDLVKGGLEMVPVRQGFLSLSAPMKELQRLILTGKRAEPVIRHAVNPAVRWQVDNLSAAMDEAGNVKPDKKRSTDKIDAWSALTTAMARALAATPEEPLESVYDDDHGLLIV